MIIICRGIGSLCKPGDTGNVKSVKRTRIVKGVSSWYSDEPWYNVERADPEIVFEFSNDFLAYYL